MVPSLNQVLRGLRLQSGPRGRATSRVPGCEWLLVEEQDASSHHEEML